MEHVCKSVAFMLISKTMLHIVKYATSHTYNNDSQPFWSDLSCNPNAITSLEQPIEHINCNSESWNASVNAITSLEPHISVDFGVIAIPSCTIHIPNDIRQDEHYGNNKWSELSCNPNAITSIEKPIEHINPHVISWTALSCNHNPNAITSIEPHIDWNKLAPNPCTKNYVDSICNDDNRYESYFTCSEEQFNLWKEQSKLINYDEMVLDEDDLEDLDDLN